MLLKSVQTSPNGQNVVPFQYDDDNLSDARSEAMALRPVGLLNQTNNNGSLP